MSERAAELLEYYRRHRVDDQRGFYSDRKDLFDRATGQGLAVSATLLGFAAAASALAGSGAGWTQVWSAASAILPAIATALAAYIALYAFDQQSKIYSDALRAINAAARPRPWPDAGPGEQSPDRSVAEFVRTLEDVFRQEHAQWGQLTSQIRRMDEPSS